MSVFLYNVHSWYFYIVWQQNIFDLLLFIPQEKKKTKTCQNKDQAAADRIT